MDNKDFNIRYARQIAIPEIGKEGQRRLSEAKVMIIGCGALGSMVAMQLAGAGIGTIGIADFDTVDISNLQRQFFFATNEAGKLKAEILAEKIRMLNSEVTVNLFPMMVTSNRAEEIFRNYDFIVDGTDNPDSKRITGIIAKKYGKPCCIGGVREFSGQIMTFLPEDPRFEEYFGQTANGDFLPCSLGGVIGPAAALCASIQSSETIKYLTSVGNLLSKKILTFNLLTNSFSIFTL